MPDAVCPICGADYAKDGFDIPFETFLGFGGDKVPDIDLNFSGEYQSKATPTVFEMFGSSHVFRSRYYRYGGRKTAYGYVMKYLQERGLSALPRPRKTGWPRAVPASNEPPVSIPAVWWLSRATRRSMISARRSTPPTTRTPISSPPISNITAWRQTLLKLDMDDDPTMTRMLEDMTGVDAKKIPLDDPATKEIFRSPAPSAG